MRKGRFDEIFFVDLPNPSERAEIFKIHIEKFGRDPEKYDIKKLVKSSKNFSGAEIREAIIAAMYDAFSDKREFSTDDIVRNMEVTVPLARTMAEKIAKLRDWADFRARRANAVEEEEELRPLTEGEARRTRLDYLKPADVGTAT
jgi:SpoVK/Ycf46/Vps4 family AAA+-type ATPase